MGAYSNLPDILHLVARMYLGDDPILPSYDSLFNVWLVRQNISVSVPEPNTLVFLGIGILGLVLYRRSYPSIPPA